MNHTKKLIAFCIIAAFASLTNPIVFGADKPVPSEKGEKKAPKHLPFRGKVAAVDQSAKTIKVGERTFHVIATTKILKAGKPATLTDVAAGDEVGGSYHEADGGKLQLMSLRVGPKPKADKN